MARTGRPSKYTKAVAEEICTRLAKGEPLYKMCKDEHLPCMGTVLEWVALGREDFPEQYARANAARAYLLAEEVQSLADEAPPEEAAATRIRVDARKWLSSKFYPKMFGEKAQVAVTGEDGGPVKHELVIKFGESE